MKAPPSAGYSGTPLIKKLGLRPGARALFVRPPDDFFAALGIHPREYSQSARGELDFAVLFVRRLSELRKDFPRLMKRLAPAGMLWVSWPKKTSGVASDLSENLIRDYGLAEGLVDVKVCAVDETWSGLKFVRRLRDR